MELNEAKKILKENDFILEETEQMFLDDETLEKKRDLAKRFINLILNEIQSRNKYIKWDELKYDEIEVMRQIVIDICQYIVRNYELNGKKYRTTEFEKFAKDEYFVNQK